jgi:hypothetical protein
MVVAETAGSASKERDNIEAVDKRTSVTCVGSVRSENSRHSGCRAVVEDEKLSCVVGRCEETTCPLALRE